MELSLRTRSRTWRRILAGAAVAWASLAVGACGAGRASNPFEGEASPGSQQLHVDIDNQGFNDIRVYALTSRGTQSLGLVPGSQHKSVQLAWRQLDQISFRLEVLAGPSYRTERLSASPGERLELVIPADPANAYVRPR